MTSNPFNLFDAFAGLRVIVIGEAMLDRYLKGSTNRLSQEAPVQVVSINEREDVPGGAANAAANIQSLGAEALFISVCGADDEANWLRQALRAYGIDDQHMLTDPTRQTLVKQRLLANDQMLVRFDQGSTGPICEVVEKELIQRLKEIAPTADAILISDYNYGVLTQRVLSAISRLQAREPRILVVDAKQHHPYKKLRVTAVKPNYAEATAILKIERKEDSAERIAQMQAYGHKLLEISGAQVAAVTLDQDGVLIFERGEPPYRIYSRPATHNRVAGAGDTFMSALTLALTAGAQTATAAEIASAAAAVVVEKPGTSACTLEELRLYISGDEKFITDSFHVAARMATYRRQGKRIVFTSGCFDLLHSGHIQFLNKAKSEGDVLVVALNTDTTVRKLKGPTRPINKLEDRAQVLAALSCIDHIIPLDDDAPESLIRLIHPDVLVKGGNYRREILPEASLVEELGGRVTILPYSKNHSTHGIIERISAIHTTKDPFNKETPEKQAAPKGNGRKTRSNKQVLKVDQENP